MQLAERAEKGEITYANVEQAATFLQLEKLGLVDRVYPARMVKERRRLVKRLGLQLSDVQADDVTADVGSVVALAVPDKHWGISAS